MRFVFPFGGVPLASLAISQSAGPLLGVARVGGVILLTWLVFQIGFVLPSLVASAIRTARRHPATWDLVPVGALAAAVLVVGAAAIAPRGHDRDLEPITIAAVQGGGEQGTTALDVPSSLVTERHLEATRTIEPSPDLDLVVWPENGIDVDRNRSPRARSTSWWPPRPPGWACRCRSGSRSTRSTPSIRWTTASSMLRSSCSPTATVAGWYEKVHIVPFGEYVPLRGLFEALGAPLDDVAVRCDRRAGSPYLVVDRDGVGIDIGVMISWEVFFGDRGRAAGDGMLMINPTNGASYTWTILQTQQVASSRLRAAETGRWVVQVSPTGFSAFVAPDGSVYDRTDVGEQAVITRAVPLRGGTTWYSTLGDWPWRALLVLTLALTWWFSWRAGAGTDTN